MFGNLTISHRWPPKNDEIRGLLFGGKARIDPEGCTAVMRLFWFEDCALTNQMVKQLAPRFVEDCYPEAVEDSIQLWAVPGMPMAVDVTFEIDRGKLVKRRTGLDLFGQYIEKTGETDR